MGTLPLILLLNEDRWMLWTACAVVSSCQLARYVLVHNVLVIIKLVTLCTMVVLYSSVGAPPCKLDHVGSTVIPTWPQTTVHISSRDSGRPQAYSLSGCVYMKVLSIQSIQCSGVTDVLLSVSCFCYVCAWTSSSFVQSAASFNCATTILGLIGRELL